MPKQPERICYKGKYGGPNYQDCLDAFWMMPDDMSGDLLQFAPRYDLDNMNDYIGDLIYQSVGLAEVPRTDWVSWRHLRIAASELIGGCVDIRKGGGVYRYWGANDNVVVLIFEHPEMREKPAETLTPFQATVQSGLDPQILAYMDIPAALGGDDVQVSMLQDCLPIASDEAGPSGSLLADAMGYCTNLAQCCSGYECAALKVNIPSILFGITKSMNRGFNACQRPGSVELR
ncbi:MAG: hypothetical protein M1827_003398 [Pycnora praestabilis]|nr:MAG: hypothetical protein M1827_003398 [Pycnora praestabilis]